MSVGEKRIQLTLSGEQTQTPSKVAFVLEAYNLHELSKTKLNHTFARLRLGLKTYCHNTISSSHSKKAWNHSTQLFILNILSHQHRSPLPVGFALFETKDKLIFIHLLCAATFERTKERTKLTSLPKSPGTILLSEIEKFAIEAGVHEIKLSAIPYVINYYRNKGFRHLYPGEEVERPNIARAAQTISKYLFKTNDEVDKILKLGEASIDTSKPSSDADKMSIAEQLSWSLPEYEFEESPNGTITALDDRGRIDKSLTGALKNLEEHAETVDAFMQLQKAGFATNDPLRPPVSTPKWDRSSEEVDVDSEDTFMMTKRIGKGKTQNASKTHKKTKRIGKGKRHNKRQNASKTHKKQNKQKDTR